MHMFGVDVNVLTQRLVVDCRLLRQLPDWQVLLARQHTGPDQQSSSWLSQAGTHQQKQTIRTLTILRQDTNA